jgi:hypothetical protein
VPKVAAAGALSVGAALLVGGGSVVSLVVMTVVYIPVVALLGAVPDELFEFVRLHWRART